ncbi:EmrB/QacA subfamily drug resistance transporter [Herbihabitans rhizosphaerae]|uniref:EmrB/QacA subfamily drug resistance transporter n=1 Tax=Herbihabitans rhizosphaerae TaxID=1872711 RepID=A0A4Q7KX37_9PSEU|nr:MFS transporter [Herbihabitans rhizosphaerae]RZS40850.1 EmrB/QacA subfamily drug resistance transporter [Herbihabitans rhizosphaerae]
MSETTLPVDRPVAPPPARVGNRGLVLATLLTCQLMLILDVTVMNVALPRIQDDLRFTPTGLSWVMSGYTLVFGGLLLLGGRAGDVFGRRRMFVAGITLFTVASLAGGLAGSAEMLLAARVAQGVGAAMAGPSTIALITTTFTEQHARMRALALFSAMASSGFAIGLIVGGLLTEWLSWRAVLFINVPFGIAIAILAVRLVPETDRRRARLDLPGAITATLGVGALVYGFIRAAEVGWGDTVTLAALAAGAALIAAFVLIELRAEAPILPLRLLADRDRAAAYVNFFLGPMAGMSMFFFLTQYLQDVRDFGALTTGFAFLPMAGTLFATSRLIPRLLPRFGPKPLSMFGSALMVAGMLMLTQLTVDSTYPAGLLAPMILMGGGMGLAFSPLNVIIMSTVPPADAGAAGGALQTMQQLGGTLGLAILVTVFGSSSRAATAAGQSPDQVLTTGATDAFQVSVVIAALSFLVALTFRARSRR